MHRLATSAAGWTLDQEGVILIEQTPAPIVILTAADTDIQTLGMAVNALPENFPAIRVASLLNLQQELTIDTYADTVLAQAKVIVLRLLGGRSYWSYGLEVCKELVSEQESKNNPKLIVLPGDDGFDLDLVSHANVPLTIVEKLWRYFLNGGVDNAIAALQFLSDTYFNTSYQPPAPQIIPKIGLYKWNPKPTSQLTTTPHTPHPRPHSIGILFYRAHYLAGNLAPIDSLCEALSDRGLTPIPIFIYSLQDPNLAAELTHYFGGNQEDALLPGAEGELAKKIDVLINTTSFSLTKPSGEDKGGIWRSLNVPVLQAIFSSSTVEQWQEQSLGLSPRDVAMNVVLPEVDGRIITRAISFKSVARRESRLETDIVVYEPVRDRIEFVADLAANWVKLRRQPASDRKVALILANYPTRNGRLANGVGLDTPASCVEILQALQKAGYTIDDIPQNGDELITRLTQGVTNDPESELWSVEGVGGRVSRVGNTLSAETYQAFFDSLPVEVQQKVSDRWDHPSHKTYPISGIQLGNIFVGIQPSRGYDQDPSLNYHAPDLEPTHAYLAFYCWLRQELQVDAIAHIGKHGNLEWLPGKGLALSDSCFPEVALGAIPHLYPFIVNDPGEGSQAKRRAQAVIIDHLTPPMTRAETYGGLQKLEHLIDEYHEAQSLDPSRTALIQAKILELVEQENLAYDLTASGQQGSKSTKEQARFSEFVSQMDGYLCELKEAQIRDGLHIFGKCPEDRQLRDLIIAIARNPGSGKVGITQAIAQSFHLEFDPLTADPSQPFVDLPQELQGYLEGECWIIGDAIAALENYAAKFVDQFLEDQILNISVKETPTVDPPKSPLKRGTSRELPSLKRGTSRELPSLKRGTSRELPSLKRETSRELPSLKRGASRELPPLKRGDGGISFCLTQLLSAIHTALQQTPQEITNFLRGLNGEYIPSGASGAPTRGRLDVLPTGRNFYSVDIRAIPTETAWDVGRRGAELLVEAYTQEHGEYPRTLGLSVWGTSTMRTGGDDIAEALALLGVQPIWDGASRRVVDFSIIPLSILGRPRVDVMLRISGFFRDGFSNLISLFHQAVEKVSQLDEPDDLNPLKAQVDREKQTLMQQGLNDQEALQNSQYRVFGSKPGAYGAGLQGLIESQNWESDRDLATAYLNWSSYAYTGYGEAYPAAAALQQRLSELQIVLHNQDNREHDLLDSDDYYQFQGGMIASVRALTGKNPQAYFGDRSRPQNPKVRSLASEISRVYRSRVVNPKWIAGVMRHGYKGAFEMAATVDYLFAYDATANCVEDFMYAGVAEAYLLDPQVQAFIKAKNPWALRDMAERLLEANQRGLWQNISESMLHELRSLVLSTEAMIEEQNNPHND